MWELPLLNRCLRFEQFSNFLVRAHIHALAYHDGVAHANCPRWQLSSRILLMFSTPSHPLPVFLPSTIRLIGLDAA